MFFIQNQPVGIGGGTALVALMLASGVFVAAESASSEPEQSAKSEPLAPLSKFMREKLDASSQVLEGLTTEDFGLIEKGASRMLKLGKAERFQVSENAVYRQHSHEFIAVMEKLLANAREKNLDGATLTWIEGTMSCLECHKWVRTEMVSDK